MTLLWPDPNRPWTALNRGCFWLTVALLPLWWHLVLVQGTESRLYYTYTSVLAYASDGPLLLTLATWPLARREEAHPFRWGPASIALVLGALAALSGASALSAREPVLSLAFAAHLALLGALYLYVINEVNDASPILALLAIVVACEALLGAVQFVGRSTYPAGQLFLGWQDEVVAAQSGASVVETAAGTRWLRAYGSVPHPNILGGFLAGTLLPLAGLYIRGAGRWTLPLLVVLLLGTAGLVLTFSRGAWLAYGVGAGVLWLLVLREGSPSLGWRGRAVELGLGTVVIWVLLLTLFSDLFFTRLADPSARLERRSVVERLALRDHALELMRSAPVTGVGSGNYVLAQLAMTGRRWPSEPVHNVPLLIWAEMGPLAAVGWVGLLLAVGVTTVRRRAREDILLAGIAAGLAALLVTSLVDHYVWTMPPMRTLLWLALGLWGRALDRPGGLGSVASSHDVY